MPEYRQDVISGRWTLLAPDRARRPQEFASSGPAGRASACPFCAGQEDQSPPSVLVLPEPPERWRVRVVPNLYPAAEPRVMSPVAGEPLHPRQAGYGFHEVVIESPEHVRYQSELSGEQWGWVLRAYRQRMQALAEHPHIAYVQVFRNCGERAGASLEHLHSQVVALIDVPPEVQGELARAAAFRDRTGQCLFCQLIRAERAGGERIVGLEGPLTAFCPYASRLPYEIWIAPQLHQARFEAISDELLERLARLLHRVLVALERRTERADLNLWLHTAPFGSDRHDHYHWHMEIVPRLAMPAGFEWGTGWSMNWLPPEAAAERLRQTIQGDLVD